jgi:hypothetical protein
MCPTDALGLLLGLPQQNNSVGRATLSLPKQQHADLCHKKLEFY